MDGRSPARVVSVSRSSAHRFSKEPQTAIHLLAGLGVEGDAHCGETVQHLYLKRRNSAAPNRMQVHLLPQELLDEVAGRGFAVAAGGLGENVLTSGIDLIALPQGTLLQLGADAIVELTCLRQPCVQIDRFQQGLQREMHCAPGSRVRYRAGVMAVVQQGGWVQPGDAIAVQLPDTPHLPLTA